MIPAINPIQQKNLKINNPALSRIFDLIVAGLGLLILSPIAVLISLIVKLTSIHNHITFYSTPMLNSFQSVGLKLN